jgi:hypothetical protein
MILARIACRCGSVLIESHRVNKERSSSDKTIFT